MTNKVIGYVLIGLGILIITFAAFSVLNVFIRGAEPVQILTTERLSSLSESGSPNLMQSLNITPDILSRTVNLTFHLLFAGFIVKVGFSLASLGIMLVRPIVVDLKTKGKS